MKVIVGLGNPGNQYENTRHNIGFRVIDELSARHNIPVRRQRFQAMTGEGRLFGEKVLLIKPLTYMNLSGQAVREVMNFYQLDPEDLLVLYDDKDIAFGSVKIRKKGSGGSHNGMASIIQEIKSQDFPRFRLSIGEKPGPMALKDFVLSKFTEEEEKTVEKIIALAADGVEIFLEKGLDESMNKINSQSVLETRDE